MKVPSRRVKESAHIGNVLIATIGAVVLFGVLYPGILAKECGPSSRPKREIMNLCTAIKAYKDEYGHLPHADTGMFLDEFTQARLLRTLQAQDLTENPRAIVFLEVNAARQQERGSKREKFYAGGISPATGAFLDPWGKPYRVQLSSVASGETRTPYTDTENARVSVIAWSLGKDGVQGCRGKENIFEGSDDVVSWR